MYFIQQVLIYRFALIIVKGKRKCKGQKRLVALLEEKDIREITVKELTQRADVNRGTFYVHYRDERALRPGVPGRRAFKRGGESMVFPRGHNNN